MVKTIKINENLFLNKLEILREVEQNFIKAKINHIFCVDCSGSMSYDLPEIRKQLKNKISDLVGDNNTITIIWFSGNKQCGIIKENVAVKDVVQLQKLHESIDKFLKPVGMTAFNDPIILTNDIIDRLNTENNMFSFYFLTDGYNNDSSISDVKKNLKLISNKLNASTFIEYGYYADSKLLSEMSEIVGGEKVFAKDFEEYDAILSTKMKKDFNKRINISIDNYLDISHDFCFSIVGNDVISYKIENKDVNIIDSDNLIYFTKSTNNKLNDVNDLEVELYAAAHILADKLDYDNVESVIRLLADKKIFEELNGAYGKQKLNNFKNNLKDCIFDSSKRYLDGKGTPKNIGYTVMDLLNLLQSVDSNLIYPQHEEFSYNRIGVKRKDKNTEISDDIKNKIVECKTKEDIEKLLDDVCTANFEILHKNKGYSLTDLVFNESRANLSFRVRYNGVVKLSKNKFNIEAVDSFIYRTYTLIKDGILNVSKIPVSLSVDTLQTIQLQCPFIIDKLCDDEIVVLDLSKLPLIDKKSVDNISAKKLAELEYDLIKLQSSLKVYKDYNKNLNPKVSLGLLEKYGEEATKFLNDLGITDFNGYSPKTTAEESTDGYMAVELNVKIKGLSSIPSVSAVNKKLVEKKNLTASEKLLEKSICDCEDLISNPLKIYEKQLGIKLDEKLITEEVKTDIYSKIIESMTKTNTVEKRTLMNEISRIKFSTILSRKWFSEFKSLDENKLIVELDKVPTEVTFELKEVFEKV